MTNCSATDVPKSALGTVTVPLRYHVPGRASAQRAVTFGVPLPRGSIFEPYEIELDSKGQSLPAAAETTAKWPDGSTQWMLVDAVFPSADPGTHSATLTASSRERRAANDDRLRVRSKSDGVTIELDDDSVSLDLCDGDLCLSIEDREHGPLNIPIETSLTLLDGQKDSKTGVTTQVECSNAIRASVAARGQFLRSGLRFIARATCRIDGSLGLDLSLHNPQRAKHHAGLWDLGDPGSVYFREFSVEIGCTDLPRKDVRWKLELDEAMRACTDLPVKVVQTGSGGQNWDSPNHVNREGKVPCGPGYVVETSGTQRTGKRASPSAVVSFGSGHRMGVAIPEFWQQFPKAIEISHQNIRLGLFPKEWPDDFELQGGERKTSTVELRILVGQSTPQKIDDCATQPIRVIVAPEWIESTNAVPFLAKRSTCDDPRMEELIHAALSGDHSFVAKREVIDEYGWRNFGDIWADHEGAYYEGSAPVISHYNNQFDVVYGAILQLMRSGDYRWYDVFDPLARHVVDIDIYHTTLDKPAYNGGLFWFTDHYVTAGTSTHRTYSRANAPSNNEPYGGGPGSEHNFSTGLLYYYYLTGNVLAAEAVTSLSDWVIAMDDGSRDVLSIVDDGPTGLASWCGGLDYHGPGRGAANSISVLLDGWILTRSHHYLEKAEQLIRRCIHPLDDLEQGDLLRAEKRWSYTMFLASLVKYLCLKLEWEQFDEMFDYAKQSLIHYTAWMERHERPYLDHPEELEYPTEAWAAQELRKANVLQMAALFVPAAQAPSLIAKGRSLAERAWDDLIKFETRHYTRATALVMVEGTTDAYFRARPDQPTWHADVVARSFGPPMNFIPQRTRVMQRARSVQGIASCVTRICNPLRWSRWLQQRRNMANRHDRFGQSHQR